MFGTTTLVMSPVMAVGGESPPAAHLTFTSPQVETKSAPGWDNRLIYTHNGVGSIMVAPRSVPIRAPLAR